jgi:hypothetical protein
VKLIPATDDLFEHLKAKDDQARGRKGAKVMESSDEESELEEEVKIHESPNVTRSLEI